MAEVRRAGPEDAGAICALINWVIRDTVVTFNSIEKRPAEIVEAMEGGAPYWVATEAGRVVGYASYGPFRRGVGYDRTREHSIVLAPDSWG
ncbi:GNAT family N-acetyltransferase, partial [Vannielia litorea]|uniref:GNAT family N-acetyltransferase n=1 Tax=Vannielia litorea TaxID=1217970 RepID=UPI0031409039